MNEPGSRSQKRTTAPSETNDDAIKKASRAVAHGKDKHTPQQRRSIETRERILKSVTTLLETDAYSSATVQDIVSAAGCSVGAFYGRFKDKDAVLFAIFTVRCAALETDSAAILQGEHGSLEHTLRKFIELVIEHTLRHKPIIRAGLIAPAASNIARMIICQAGS